RGRRTLVQPGVKVRGPEYLRIIYGPEYTAPHNLERLRDRNLGRKRSLALREFALGVEALERFVRGEPLYRVHECVFGVLALESEPVDPRLSSSPRERAFQHDGLLISGSKVRVLDGLPLLSESSAIRPCRAYRV